MRKYLNPNMPLSAVRGEFRWLCDRSAIAKEAPDNVRRQIQQSEILKSVGGQTPAAPQRISVPPPDEATSSGVKWQIKPDNASGPRSETSIKMSY